MPRSSVFRIWQTKADYLVDLYETLAGPQGGARGSLFAEQILKDEVFAGVDDAVSGLSGNLDDATTRRALLEEVIRTGVAKNFTAISAPSEWQTYAQMMISSPVLTDLPDGLRIADTQVQTERDDVIAKLADRYRTLFEGTFRLKLRDPQVSYEHFVIAASSVIEGFATREVLARAASEGADTSDPSLHALTSNTIKRKDAAGNEAEWLPSAIAYLGVVDAYFEAA
ncbi:hypothetical protein [Rarobacter faecitabidus]|uniref:hypothetical protein n=1 Tax=Rarobacter faecitabidus TaxID=13243 RepID=UPI001151F377|nr:hypothetical protein [Rarobacter faecitabidus]